VHYRQWYFQSLRLRWKLTELLIGDKESCTKRYDCVLPSLRWNHIRAFGEHKTSPEAIGKVSISEEIVYTLLNRAQHMFYHQPTRTHLHCFALGGDHLRCSSLHDPVLLHPMLSPSTTTQNLLYASFQPFSLATSPGMG
jgi:hypothetical protein